MNYILEILLLFIPMFVNDRVALHRDDSGEWEVYCREEYAREQDKEYITAYGSIKTFTWLGFYFGGEVTLDD